MPSIEARRNANGEVTSYRIIVSAGLDYQGKQVKRRSIWTPPSYGMSECQMEREARAAAYKFEEQIRNGYELDNNQTFAEYAQYVLDLKERNGLSPRTLDRYIEMLPRINQSIGHLKLNAIRPQHLNELYKELGRRWRPPGYETGHCQTVPEPDSAPCPDFQSGTQPQGPCLCQYHLHRHPRASRDAGDRRGHRPSFRHEHLFPLYHAGR